MSDDRPDSKPTYRPPEPFSSITYDPVSSAYTITLRFVVGFDYMVAAAAERATEQVLRALSGALTVDASFTRVTPERLRDAAFGSPRVPTKLDPNWVAPRAPRVDPVTSDAPPEDEPT